MGRFEQLAAFVEVVDQHGFSAAGQKLGVVKSVLSRRVSELEARLGVKLLNRTTRQLSLTGAGEHLYQQLSVLLPELIEAEQKVSEEQLRLTGALKITAPLSFGYRHLSSVISEFILLHPEIDVSLELNDREIDLVAEGYDLAIRIGELNDSTLIARKLCQIRFVSVTSDAYLELHGEPTHPSELVNHEGLFYSNVSDRHQWQFVDDSGVLIVVPRQRLRANNGDFLVNAAMQGLGIFQSPTFLCDDFRREGKLRCILEGYQRPGLGMYAVYPPGRLIPRRVKLLVDFLHEKFSDLPEWDKGLP
jgi:DNA-binding transcriptional LysR family regulator